MSALRDANRRLFGGPFGAANWLGEAGLTTDRFELSGPFAYFDARLPSV